MEIISTLRMFIYVKKPRLLQKIDAFQFTSNLKGKVEETYKKLINEIYINKTRKHHLYIRLSNDKMTRKEKLSALEERCVILLKVVNSVLNPAPNNWTENEIDRLLASVSVININIAIFNFVLNN